MNKFVLLLGVVVIAILAMMFFCVGFFTGTTITTSDITSITQENAGNPMEKAEGITDTTVLQNKESTADKLAADKTALNKIIDAVNDNAKSLTISDKIIKILAAAGYATETFSNIVKANKIPVRKTKKPQLNNKLTIDALLREISAEHKIDDNCSFETTKQILEDVNNEQLNEEEIKARKIVFIGYFKDNVAAQIQKLLSTKGYKVHIEHSKVWNSDESFIFCGPFEKEENADKLVSWLKVHDFPDAHIIDIIKESKEDKLLDSISESSANIPENEENKQEENELQKTYETTTVVPVVPIDSEISPQPPIQGITPVPNSINLQQQAS